jgi:NAD(P)-dependent dehydrogenase (short-subunit alcohol dehydrogenase family)
MAHETTLKSILVTGGARRIGAAIAKRFAEAGWHVVVHYNRSADEAANLVASLASAESVQCDLADADAAKQMVIQLAERLPDWRVLVNNASIFQEDSVTALDSATNRLAMQINATTPALIAQTFLAHTRSRTGRRVIQLTDQKLANPNPDFFSYSMSKHAADAAAEMLAMACEGEDRVYRLAPGAILASHDQEFEEAERSHRMNLLRRRTSATEVADAALFLAEGTLANGQELFVDSGQHLLSQARDVIYLARGEND